MHLFSTIIFIDGNPVGYKVYQDEPNKILLTPAESAAREIHPPLLTATKTNGRWHIEGTENSRIVDQVVQDLEQNKSLLLSPINVAP